MKRLTALLCLCFGLALPLSAQLPVDTLELTARRMMSEGLYYDALELLDAVPDSLRSAAMARQRTQVLVAFARYDEAADQIRPRVERDSLVADLQLLAGIYESTAKRDSAIVLREAIYHRSPYNIINALRLSQLFEEAGVAYLGLTMLNSFLYEYPDNRPVRQRRAAVCYTLGDYDEAFADFDRLYRTGDRSINTVYYHGRSLMEQDSLAEAVPVLEEAVRISGEANPYPLLDLSYVSLRLQQPDRSRLCLAKVDSILHRTPQLLQIVSLYHDQMAETEYLSGRYRAALGHLTEVAKGGSLTPDLLYRQALVYRKLERYAEERKALEGFLEKTAARCPEGMEVKETPRMTYARRRLEQLREERFMTP